MYVTADNPIVAFRPRVVRRRLLEALNVPEARADAELDSLHERPVRLAETAPHIIYSVVQRNDKVVQGIADSGKPRGASNDPVEPVAVRYQQSLTERGPMYPFAVN